VFTTLLIIVPLVLLVVAVARSVGVFRVRRSWPVRPPIYESVKRIERVDVVCAVEIFRGDHGLFRFEEMSWREPDADDPYDEGYWASTRCSGLYDTAEAAERDARAEIPWLREAADA
jgi:hypothetical protein